MVTTPPRGLRPLEGAGFAGAALALGAVAGLYDRHPFDDEIHTLVAVERLGFADIFLGTLAGGDIHPPLATLFFKALWTLGLDAAAMRVAAMALTVSAFALILDLTLRRLYALDRTGRVVVSAIFVACPLLYGAGDSLRWYPPFAASTAAFVVVWIRAGRPTILAGALLGLAASTSFLAIVPGAAVALRRYAVQRRFEPARDLPFLAAALLCASPGLITFWNVAAKAGDVRDGSLLVAPLASALGFLGGGRLGPSLIPVLLPSAIVVAAAMVALAIRRRDAARPSAVADDLAPMVLSLIAVSAVVVAALGLTQPRASLFVAPFVCAAIALALPAATWSRFLIVAALAAPTALIVATPLPAAYPFKRNLAIPVADVLAWIDANAPADAAIATSEPVLEYLLDRRGRCVVGRMGAARACDPARFAAAGAVVILRDHAFEAIPQLRDAADRTARARRPALTASFGVDRDAALKSSLTGVALPPWILRAELWR